MAFLVPKSAILVILTMHVEVEGHTMAQNDGLNEADKNCFFEKKIGHYGHLEQFLVWCQKLGFNSGEVKIFDVDFEISIFNS